MRGSKTNLILGGMIIVLMILAFSACKKSTEPTTNLDKDAILRLVAEDDSTFSTDVIDTASHDADTGALAKVTAVDSIRFFWRKIISRTRTVNVSIYPADSTCPYPYAYVTVIDTLYGELHILGKDDYGYKIHLVKPLTDEAIKSAYFVKIGNNEDPYRGWRIEGISGLLSHSVPTCTRTINQLHLVSPGYDVIFTEEDITGITLRDSLLTFDIDDSVTLTVTTADNTDSVYLHAPSYNCRPHRRSFTNNGDGTFTITLPVDDMYGAYGWHHFAVDVIKHSTLDGDDAYDSRIWGLVYRVTQP
jgi:hypothetical protein